MIKAVVFDLDGTIAGFNLDYKTVRAEVQGYLLRMGMPASSLSINESIFEMLKKAEIYMKNSGKNERTIQRFRENALAIAEKRELEAAGNTNLSSGVIETLRALREMKLKIGLCTINGEKSTDLILKRFNIRDLFDAITPRNKVRHVKPSSEHLIATLKDLQVKPREAIIVGDGIADMKSACEVGSLAVGFRSRITEADELVESGANYFITSITDLPPLVACLNS